MTTTLNAIDCLTDEQIRDVLARIVASVEANDSPAFVPGILREWSLIGGGPVLDEPEPEPEPSGNPLLQAILDAPTPTVRRASLRREPRKVWAAEVRKLLRDLGIKGVSVTAPNYSMANSIDVTLPRVAEHERGWQSGHEYAECPLCQQKVEAERRIQAIILAAFPDLDDRSDYMSDYHDNCLSVH